MPQRPYKQEAKIHALYLSCPLPLSLMILHHQCIMDKSSVQAKGHALLGFTKPDPDTTRNPLNVIIWSSVASTYWTFMAKS